MITADKIREIKERAFMPGWIQPTVTIEEAAEADLREAQMREKRQKEAKLVKEFGDDSSEETKKQREWDDFRDENPKGSGNTGTKGYFYG